MGIKVPKLGIAGAILIGLYVIVIGSLITFIVMNNDIPILDPQGMIAGQQRSLMGIAVGLMLLVVIPVFILAAYISWKYRASNKKAKHSPDWDHNNTLEAIWWGFPLLLIIILSVITFQSSHTLDPFRKIESNKPAVEIQVVALQWRWLFIYPEHNIATINEIKFPEKTPVNFTITSDAPMNSFWIPALGGQVYAMSGMSTKLHLMADKLGSYNGASANISGEGFSGMKFKAYSTTDTEYKNWIQDIKSTGQPLNLGAYHKLALPSKNSSVAYYKLEDPELYDKIIMKYMGHGSEKKDGDSEGYK